MPPRGHGALRRAIALGVLAALPFTVAAGEPELLEPERAFPLTARPAVEGAKGVELSIAIRDGHYLYANRFRVEAPGLPVGRLQVPPGEEKDDAFVGKSRVLKGVVVLAIPFEAPVAPGEYGIHLTAQGCAEGRACYAPFTQSVRVRIP